MSTSNANPTTPMAMPALAPVLRPPASLEELGPPITGIGNAGVLEVGVASWLDVAGAAGTVGIVRRLIDDVDSGETDIGLPNEC